MEVHELEAALAGGELAGAYLVAGAEALLRDEALGLLRAAALDGGPEDLNVDRLDGDRATPADLDAALGALPMLAARRLVWLRDPAGTSGRGRAALTDALAEWVPRLEPGGPVVLVASAASADRRAAWVKAFPIRVECSAPRDRRGQLAFVRSEAKRQGLRLGRGVAEALLDRVGPHLLALRAELEKTALLVHPETAIDTAALREAVAEVAEEPIWDLTDAIGEGRGPDALRVLRRLLDGGAPGPVVLGALASHFRRLVRVREGASVAGPPFVVRKLERQAGRYAPTRLRGGLAAIHETDLVLKGQGAVPPETALERLVLNLSV